jgi:hypothetical protein
LKGRLTGRDRGFIDENRSQPLNRPPRCRIVRIARHRHDVIKQSDKRRDRPARLEGVSTPATGFKDFKPDVPCANPDVLRIAHPKIKMTGIGTVFHQNPEVICRHKTSRRITGDNPEEIEPDLVVEQIVWRDWKCFDRRRRHGLG